MSEVFKGFGPKFQKKIIEIAVGEGLLPKGEKIEKLGEIVETLNSTKNELEKLKEISDRIQKLNEEKSKIENEIVETLKNANIDQEKLKKFFNSQLFSLLTAVEILDPELANLFSQPTSRPLPKNSKRVLIYKGKEITMSQLREIVPEIPKSYSVVDLLNSKKWTEKIVERIEEKEGKVYIYLKENL